MLLVDLLNSSGEPGIFSCMLGHLAVFPGIIATLRDIQYLTEQTDRVLLAVLGDELEGYTWLREKMPIAFFRISRSCRSNSFSRLRRRSSSSWSI